MATYRENLEARRNNVAAQIAALDATKAGGLPNSSASGVDHEKHKEGLYAELEKLEALIEKELAKEEVAEVVSEAYSG